MYVSPSILTLVKPIWKHVRYAIHYKRNIRDLTGKVNTLTLRREKVNEAVETATRNLDLIDPEVEAWLRDVQQTIAEKEANFGEERLANAW